MKKKIIISIIVMLMTTLTMSAQVFVGGSLGISYQIHEEWDKKSPTAFQFSISPKIGYKLSNRFSVGTLLSVSSGTSKEILWGSPNHDKKQTSTSFGASGFGRYSLFEISKFALIAEGQIGFRRSSWKTLHRFSGWDEWWDPPTSAISATTFYVNVFPVLAYNLSNKLTLDVSFCFFNIGYSTTSSTERTQLISGGIGENKTKDTYYGFNVDTFLGSINNWFESITVGVFYKF